MQIKSRNWHSMQKLSNRDDNLKTQTNIDKIMVNVTRQKNNNNNKMERCTGRCIIIDEIVHQQAHARPQELTSSTISSTLIPNNSSSTPFKIANISRCSLTWIGKQRELN